MELSAATSSHKSGRRNKFKLSSFPEYVRKVQQISSNQSVTANRGLVPLQLTRSKKQTLSRALSCFETSSNSPLLNRSPARPRAATLPPLHNSLGAAEGFGKTNKLSKTTQPYKECLTNCAGTSSPLAIHRASSFPQIDPKPVCQQQKVKNKSPYLQPLVHKPYYRKQLAPRTDSSRSPKNSRTSKTDSRTRSHTIHEISDEKQRESTCMDKPVAKEVATLTIPYITLRTATPSGSESDLSASLTDQFAVRKQLAAELEKLNREVHDIVVCVDKVE